MQELGTHILHVGVNISTLNKFEDGARVDETVLRAIGTSKGRGHGIKILGTGEITKKLTVAAHAFSATARQKIEAAGGSCEVVGIKVEVKPKVKAKAKAKVKA